MAVLPGGRNMLQTRRLHDRRRRPSMAERQTRRTTMPSATSPIHARLGHVAISAHDKPLLERFYTTVLGLMVTDSGQARSGMELTFMSGNAGNHHQLVLVSG